MKDPKEWILNWGDAQKFIDATENPIDRVILEIAQWQVLQRFIKFEGITDEDIERETPIAPFDMRFHLKIVRGMFKNKSGFRELLAGTLNALDTFPID